MQRLFIFLACLALSAPAWAKRPPVPVLPPVDDGGYRFVALNEPLDHHDNSYWGGHVVAYLKSTGDKVWEKWLYQIKVFSDLPSDLQEVYLKKMYLQNPNLLILQNEKGAWFVLEKHTGELIKGKKFKKRADDPSVYYSDGTRIEPILKGSYFIQAEDEVSFGHQKVWAYDLPTGKLLWEKKVNVPRDSSGERSRISFMVLNDKDQVEITFDDGSEARLDVKSGKTLKIAEK